MSTVLRVLIVEDHDDSREILAELLQLLGAAVSLAASVKEAIAQVESFAPDVILSDVSMPGEDGYDLARRLDGHPNRKSMRLVAVTGFTGSAAHDHAKAAGYDAVLAKPLAPDALKALLRPPGAT